MVTFDLLLAAIFVGVAIVGGLCDRWYCTRRRNYDSAGREINRGWWKFGA